MIGIVIQQYYVDAVQALDILSDAKTQATAGTVLPTGWLRLIVPVWFATPYFTALLARFSEQYPDIQFSIDLENRFTDLVAEGYDLAFLPEWLIADAVADGRLIKIFAEEFNAVPLYAVYMNRTFLSSKIRLLIDFLHKYLNGDEA